MALYNPYRNYDKGMDDAYCGNEPVNPNSQQYMEGYEYGYELMRETTKNEIPKERTLVTLKCEVCGTSFLGPEPQRCCDGRDCTCLGLPMDPIVCSEECYYTGLLL